MKIVSVFLFLTLFVACITVDEKMAMVSAKGLKDLKCPNDVEVVDLGKDRFSAQCKIAKKGKAYYQVKCGRVPKSCKVLRFRK